MQLLNIIRKFTWGKENGANMDYEKNRDQIQSAERYYMT